eukprot:2440803-Rhodomonas_salina.1
MPGTAIAHGEYRPTRLLCGVREKTIPSDGASACQGPYWSTFPAKFPTPIPPSYPISAPDIAWQFRE